MDEDILNLEKNANAPDPDLISRVFRSIHSIKGVAGFIGLGNIRDLSHVMETLLALIRDGEIKPEVAYTRALLTGVDHLRGMLQNVEDSDSMDISEIHERLSRLLDGSLSPETKQEIETVMPLKDTGGIDVGFDISQFTLNRHFADGDNLYVLKFDLMQGASQEGLKPMTVTNILVDNGEIMDARIDNACPDLSDGLPACPLCYDVLYRTRLDPAVIAEKLDLSVDRIVVLEYHAEPQPLIDFFDEETCEAETSEPQEFPITPELVSRFLSEAEDLVETAEQSLLQIKDNPAGTHWLVAECRRVVHSLKGNCGILGYADIQKLSHKMEEVLECMADETTSFDSAGGTLLQIIDMIREGLADIAGGGKGEIQGCDILVELLQELIPASSAPVVARGAPPIPESAPKAASKKEKPKSNKKTKPVGKSTVQSPSIPVPFPPDGVEIPKPPYTPAASPPPIPPMEPARPEPKACILPKSKTAPQDAAKPAARRDIRVDLEKLDSLINLVGELVIAESMVTKNDDLEGLELESFDRAAHHLRRIINDIQDVAMSVRMVPISTTFRRMIRLVHDLSERQDKKVQLQLVGEETEVDKTVVEMIADPLVHIVRNAVDHGLELPGERLAVGKSDGGHVVIEAKHEGGEVWISVKDDGRGLSREKILAKAVERGLVHGDGREMSDEEVYQLIFEPGLSTASAVTDVSGRGVGMDVVKSNIEKLKGRVDVQSRPGEGATTVLRLPLTLAIMEGMLIRVGAARYTIPILAVRETFRPSPKQITVAMDGQELARVRDEIIPVIRLHELFRKKPEKTELHEGILIIVEYNRKCVALFADEIIGQHQTVIKNLPEYLGNSRGISGCTILGNGEISLIVDVAGILDITGERG